MSVHRFVQMARLGLDSPLLRYLTAYNIDQVKEGCLISSFFLDFNEASKCLNHSQLHKKFKALGINGQEAKLFPSCLNDSHKLVEIY